MLVKVSQALWARSAALVCIIGIASAQYIILDTFNSSNFFDAFSFFSGANTGTNGYVQYLSLNAAMETGLAADVNGSIYLGVDYTTINPSGGRAAIQVTSLNQYTHGLFIADIAHMPGGICSVWPAFWTVGPNWPAGGEIDIIEGVNDQTTNAVTLHTSAVCSISDAGAANGTIILDTDCNSANAFDGCSERNSNTQGYGSGFNAIGGGVYAMEWTSTAISIYFFPRNAIPSDILAGNPNVSDAWGAPQAQFSGGGCDIDLHFANHNIVFDTTFCGNWAGEVWSDSPVCVSKAATCDAYVANNPTDFVNAYWLINSLKVYTMS